MQEAIEGLTLQGKTEPEKAVILCEYLGVKVRNHKYGDQIDDIAAYEILEKGFGACDQKALVLVALAEQAGIEGHLVYLYGYDSISHHTVAELKINQSWAMFDPYFQYQFWTSANTIASVKDIVDQKVKVVNLPLIDSAKYARLFETRYPYKVIPRAKLGVKTRLDIHIMRLSYSIYGHYMTTPWISIYLSRAEGRMP